MRRARLATARGALLTAALAAGLCATAQADMIWSGPVNINIPSTSTGVYLDVVSGVHSTSSFDQHDIHAYVNHGILLSFNSDYGFPFGDSAFASRTTLSQEGGVNNVPEGYLIGQFTAWSSDDISNGAGQATSPFWTPNSDRNLLGFRFDNEVTSQTHYGWARASLGPDYHSQPMSLVEYAYESRPGVGIHA